jgi:toxin ParE1/3/4
MTYRYNEVAELELKEAAQFYEKRSSGLGLEFLEEVDAGITRILRAPLLWLDEGDGIRRYRIRRFPYALFYRMTGSEEVEIVAVADLRRKPGYWRDRL